MRKLREVIRLKLSSGYSARAISRSCKMSASTTLAYLGRVADAKLTWPLPPELDSDEALDRLLFPDEKRPQSQRPEPDWVYVHKELRRKHVTKELLWHEYRAVHRDGYQYSQFCERYSVFLKKITVTMRQRHIAGEKMFIDFSGDGIDVVDPTTGERQKAKLFLAVLGASNLTYAEPVFSEDLPTWTACHVRALGYFGGSPEIWVPDNLRSGVTRPDRYDPDLNPTYADLAAHYGAAVMPARVRKPRDKAKVEQGVLLAERWILAVLRHRTFFSLEELREAVRPLVEKLNNRLMQVLKKSRRQVFEEIEQTALKPLPPTPYEYCDWARPRVRDYHVEFARHHYSVQHDYNDEQLDLRATATVIEIFRKGLRITSHVRSDEVGGWSTKTEHMPRAHREYAEWTPAKLVDWAKSVGPQTSCLIEKIMRERRHPQQGLQAGLGILHLRERYPDQRIEAAAARALRTGTCSHRSMVSILTNKLDQVVEEETPQGNLPDHGNIRGAEYYH